MKVLISERDNKDEFSLDTDCNPKYEYTCDVPDEFVEHYFKIMAEYKALMISLKDFKKTENEPLE